ncbi:transmembrane protein 214 [Anopheles darlingi]|uniref:Transmembrane protein 214 n=1 Tax=Anopheles darlingi TaxID=43151 RepID=A0A2M4CGL3_ANODA|nr:transmembrane protein 214 [Anopheles darlingi]
MSSEWAVVGKQKKSREQKGDKKSQNASAKVPKIEDNAAEMDAFRLLYADLKEEMIAKLIALKDSNGKAGLKAAAGTLPNSDKRVPMPTGGQAAQPAGRNGSKAKEPEKLKRSVTSATIPFKNLEAAFAEINANELRSQLVAVNVQFKDNPLMVLKALTGSLNSKLRLKDCDPVYSGRSNSYPYDIVPKDVRRVIDDCIVEAGEENVKYFFDLTLSNLVTDMNTNLPYHGHKLMLQAIANHHPSACVNNLARNAILRNSYQNRSNIGLSLLWALGQGGYKDLNVGLKVWQDIMVPVLDLKSYSEFVSTYVNAIVSGNSQQRLDLGSSEFLTILSSLTQPKRNDDLESAARQLVEQYVLGSPKAAATFTVLFNNVSFITRPTMIHYGLALCLLEDPECTGVWMKLYRNHLQTSLGIFNFLIGSRQDYNKKVEGVDAKTQRSIYTSRPDVFDDLFSEEHFLQFLAKVNVLNQELNVAKKEVEVLKSITAVVKELQQQGTSGGKSKKKPSNKGNSQASSSSSVTSCVCKFLFATFLLFGVTGALLGYDTYRAGGKFEASLTGQTLKQAGLLPAVQDAWTCTLKFSARGYKWAEANLPGYYQATCKALGPYVEFSIDFSKVLWNGAKKGFANAKQLAQQKLPVVADFIEQYAPGLPKKIGDAVCSSCDALCAFTVKSYNFTVEFFKTKVFVGQLSSENLGKVYNNTQQAAAQYYSWFNDQVNFYAKLK